MTYFKCLTWIQYLQVLFIFLSIQVSEYHCLDSDLTHSNVFNGIAEVYLQISWKISKENELQRPRHRECIIVLHKFLGCDIKLLLWGVCLLFFFLLFLTYWQPVAGWGFFFFQCIIDQVNCTTEQCRVFFLNIDTYSPLNNC